MAKVGPKLPRAKNFVSKNRKSKQCLSCFFDKKGVAREEFVPEGPEAWKIHSFNLLHDSAPGHSATIVQQFLVEKKSSSA